MPRRKRQHLAELPQLPNFLDHPHNYSGKWHSDIFQNNNPIMLELGCGKGSYAIALAKLFPEMNVIGIDKKGDRLWHGVTMARELGLSNVRFARLPIEKITDYFASEEVSEIWITFPDPYPRRGEAKKRLVSPEILAHYQKFLRSQGRMHLKTDNDGLFEYACSWIAGNYPIHRRVDDIYQQAPEDPLLTIQTTFERKYLALGKKIHYLCWSFT